MTKKMKNAISIFLISILCCGCSSSAPTDEQIGQIYSRNSADFEKMTGICSRYPSIENMRPSFFGTEIDAKNSDKNLVAEDQDVILRIFRHSKVDKIQCSHAYKRGVGKLVCISFDFIVTSTGVPVRVKSLLLNIELSDDFVRSKIQSGVMRSIGKEQWYVYELDN